MSFRLEKKHGGAQHGQVHAQFFADFSETFSKFKNSKANRVQVHPGAKVNIRLEHVYK